MESLHERTLRLEAAFMERLFNWAGPLTIYGLLLLVTCGVGIMLAIPGHQWRAWWETPFGQKGPPAVEAPAAPAAAASVSVDMDLTMEQSVTVGLTTSRVTCVTNYTREMYQ